MDFQEQIDSIIVSGKDKISILHELSVFLDEKMDIFFCDFDDTLIAPGISTEAYYWGNKLVHYFGFRKTPFILPRVSISSVFLDNIPANTQSIIILTRNFLPLVKELVNSLEKDLAHHNLNVIGIIGKVPSTFLDSLTSHDKLKILPSSAALITDVFEYAALRHDARCVFLPPPYRGPIFIVLIIHWCIKLRDYLWGAVRGLFGR